MAERIAQFAALVDRARTLRRCVARNSSGKRKLNEEFSEPGLILVRRFQLRLSSDGISAASMNNTVSGLRFFFRVTLGRTDIASHLPFVRQPHKLPVVLSPEEVSRFLAAAPR